jgi:cell division protein FtsQ
MRYFWTGCMGVLLGSWLFWNMAYIFPVKQVMVVTDGLYSPPGVFEQAIASAFPFGYMDTTQKIRQVVEKTDWVRQMVVKKQFPGRWWLRITTKKPVLQWSEGRNMLDSYGHLMSVDVPKNMRGLPKAHVPLEQRRKLFQLWKLLNDHEKSLCRRLESVFFTDFEEWELAFSGSIKVKLGGLHTLERMQLFIRLVKQWDVLRSKSGHVFDFRYKNGFSHRVVKR